MNKRNVAKFAAKLMVSTAAGTILTKSLIANAPKTEQYKIAEMTGALGGWMLSEKLEPYTDQMVDDYFDRRESRKK